ncbi:hypothetical protein EMPS_10417 [Entomortierella parvispora]|uniref:Secreted protein n=1 Tax=Entomortierella parvispora TaxID=205924 RepID=A0A9P3HK97_9FUNG|nr:hypothetical protein EMPS_10417 [Entomortierella parvispora]
MRSSLFLAAAATLLASSVSAHPGHDDAASVCLTTPTDPSCSTFTFPNATLSAAIGDICKTSSFLPGCSLNTACAADASLPATQCAPLTILATLCTATDDTAVTTAVCSKTYGVFCAANSLIPSCKTQVAFPGLPSGKAVAGAVYSICQEMAAMTDCKICPAPDATGYSSCDQVKAWKGLCLDMPDMKQCPSYNDMCKATPFAPFCTAAYVAPSTPTTSSAPAPSPSGDHSGHGSGNSASSASSVMASGAMTLLSVALAGALAL